MYSKQKMKRKFVTAILVMTALGGTIIPTATIVNASEEFEASGVITRSVKNDKMLAFERELSRPETRVSFASEEIDEEAAFNYFVEKYDGAEVQHFIGRNAAFSERFHVGGLNVFASNRSALQYGRSELAVTSTLLQMNGTLIGAKVGGPAGALLGLIGGSILASRFRSGSNTMRRWIDVGSNRGGSRMTASEEFPISSLATISQAPVRPI